jgi:hypothetical protein
LSDRKFPRISFVSKANVVSGDNSFEAMTDNLSLGGLLLRTETLLPVGRSVLIKLNIPSTYRTTLNLRSEVLRSHAGGIAFQFKSMDYETFTELKAVIQRYSPNFS